MEAPHNPSRSLLAAEAHDPRVSVVTITRDRREELLRTLGHLTALPERPRVIVVDNGSSDDTVEAVRERFPQVDVVALEINLGAAGRNLGVDRAKTPYVAFSDDDSWWASGALTRIADVLDAHPRLAVAQGHILVGEEERDDPIHAEMADSPLPPEPDMPGHPVASFVGCVSVVRRSAFLAVGGFDERLLVGGEEEHLAADLAAAGWSLAYIPEARGHHHASSKRGRDARRRQGIRNTLWFAWLRRPLGSAVRRTLMMARRVPKDVVSARGFLDAARGLPWVLRERRVVPPHVERRLRLLDEPQMSSRRYRS